MSHRAIETEGVSSLENVAMLRKEIYTLPVSDLVRSEMERDDRIKHLVTELQAYAKQLIADKSATSWVHDYIFTYDLRQLLRGDRCVLLSFSTDPIARLFQKYGINPISVKRDYQPYHNYDTFRVTFSLIPHEFNYISDDRQVWKIIKGYPHELYLDKLLQMFPDLPTQIFGQTTKCHQP